MCLTVVIFGSLFVRDQTSTNMVQSFDDHDDDDFDQLLKVSSRFDAFDSYGSIDAFEDFDAFEDLLNVRSAATVKTSRGRNTRTSVMNKPNTATSSRNHIHHTSTNAVHVDAVAASENLGESQKTGGTHEETYGNQSSTRLKDLEQWQRQWSEFEGREGMRCTMDVKNDIEDDEDIVAAAVETSTMTVSRLSKRHVASKHDFDPSSTNRQTDGPSSLTPREDAPPSPPCPSVPRTGIDSNIGSDNTWQRRNNDVYDEYETITDGRRICQDLSSSILSRNNKEEICSSISSVSSRRSGLIGHKHSHFSNTKYRPSSPPVEKDLVVPILVNKAHGDFSSWKRELTENTIRHEEKCRDTGVETSVPSPPPSSSTVRISSIKLAKKQMNEMMEDSVFGDKAGEDVDIRCQNINGQPKNEALTDESQERNCWGGDRADNDTADDVDDDCSVLATISAKDDDCIEQWRREITSPIPDDRMIQRMLQEDSSFSSSPFDEKQCDRDIPIVDDTGRSEVTAQETTTTKLISSHSENEELFPLLSNQDTAESENDEMALASSLMKKNTEDLAAIKVELGRVKALIQEPLSLKRTGEVTLAQDLVKKKTEDLEAIKVELGKVKALIKEPLSQKHESSNGKYKVKRNGKTKKSVKFSSNLITNTYYRPKTLPEEIENLYWDEDELDRWEEDRVNTSPDRIEVTLSTASSFIRKSATKSVSKSLAGKAIIGIDNQMGHTILHCNQYHDDDTVSNVWIETESIASF